MRIAYLSAGISIHDRRYLQKMVERGHQPFLISFWHEPVKCDIPGVVFYHYPAKGYLTKLRKILYLKKLLRHIRPDVIHSGFLQTHGFIAAFAGNYPILSMPWGSDVLLLPQQSLFNKFAAKFVLNRAGIINCDCELVKKRILELVKYDPEKIVVIPCGTDLKIFYPREPKKRNELGWQNNKVLIMTRNFMPVYGIEYFIDALPMITAQDHSIRVLMVGDGPLLNEMQKKVANYGLNEKVHFTGSIGPEAMADHLNAADIYVSTSLSDGTSVSLLEAMACRLAAVVSDLPANREWIDDGVNGYIVPTHDSKALAKKILELAANEPVRKRMAELSYKKVREKADWDENFIKLEEMYKQICLEYSQQ